MNLPAQKALDLVVLATLILITVSYLYDTIEASGHIYNLVFVMPISLFLLVLCLIQVVICFSKIEVQSPAEPVSSVLPVIALFSAYVLTLGWLGFDIGTTLFISAFLWLHGERRGLRIVCYALAFGFGTALFFSKMLPYPMPMLVLSTKY